MEFEGIAIKWQGSGVYALRISPSPTISWSGAWEWVPAFTNEEKEKHLKEHNELRWISQNDITEA